MLKLVRIAGYLGLLVVGILLFRQQQPFALPDVRVDFWTVIGFALAAFAIFEFIRAMRAILRRTSRWHYKA